jgi:paraquat-inducible protein B
MSDKMIDKDTLPTPEIPDADLKQTSTGISAVWVIPIVAALIGGWLVFQNITEEKAIAEVTFKSASGLEAGKTVIKLRNIKVGEVKDVRFSDDLSNVVVVMEFNGVRQSRLTDTTRFWVVKPRVGAGGVSGLDTLISGAYIEVDPGDGGEPVNTFTGLEEPDIYQLGNPGTRYVLSASELGSLSRGSPVKFRDIEVGTVTRYKMAEGHSHVEVEIFVRAPHDEYVKQNTRFWNISGLEVEIGAEGVKLDLDSVASLLAGGIAFSTKDDSVTVAQAPEKTVFKLHKKEQPNFEESLGFGAPMKLYFDDGVSGLSVGAPVEYKGLRIGTVADIGVEIKDDHKDILAYAMIDIEPDRLPYKGTRLNLTNEQRVENVYEFFEYMVINGVRAQLKTGSFLTGQSLVALDIFPADAKATLKYVDGIPILPTVPVTLSGIMDQVEKITARIEAMPIEEISSNLEQTTASINSLVKSLNAAEGGMMGVQMHEVMEELARAARSIRSMSEYLERHPEALLKGKSAE